MRQFEEKRSMQNLRGNATKELKKIATKALVDAELESLTLFKLLRAFERAMQNFETAHPNSIHRIVNFSYTIEDQQKIILSKIKKGQRTGYKKIFSSCQNRIHAIVTFLALLELLNLQKLSITIGEGTNNFWVEPFDKIAA